jgi:hypothetical protein
MVFFIENCASMVATAAGSARTRSANRSSP